MAITNLTNTKWVFNDTLTGSIFGDGAGNRFNINFTSNDTTYTTILFYYRGSNGIEYGSDYVYSSSSTPHWQNQYLKSIAITDGADVENADLIALLEANATQVSEIEEPSVPSLKNTMWKFKFQNSFPTITANLNFVVKGETYVKFEFTSDNSLLYIGGGDTGGKEPIYCGELRESFYTDRVIMITGGMDARDEEVIAWLEQNAIRVNSEVNLVGTTWVIADGMMGGYTAPYEKINLNFTSNDKNYSSINFSYPGTYQYSYDEEVAYTRGSWQNDNFRTITITGGEHANDVWVENWLKYITNQLFKTSVKETKVALKIYDNLSWEEFDKLEKEEHAFYIVNNYGIYKGDKKIASL